MSPSILPLFSSVLRTVPLYITIYVCTGCSKKNRPAYIFSHSDYNFIPMKLKFQDVSAERIIRETTPNWELHHRIFCVKNYYKCG